MKRSKSFYRIELRDWHVLTFKISFTRSIRAYTDIVCPRCFCVYICVSIEATDSRVARFTGTVGVSPSSGWLVLLASVSSSRSKVLSIFFLSFSFFLFNHFRPNWRSLRGLRPESMKLRAIEIGRMKFLLTFKFVLFS